jgi:hypothetical protein
MGFRMKRLLTTVLSLCLLTIPAFAGQSKGFSKPNRKSGPSRVYTVGSSHTYITGPHWGCYYINGRGGKTYVNRSLCSGSYRYSGMASTYSRSVSGGSRTYITGQRGGCYYINSNGNKTYVDKSLCH